MSANDCCNFQVVMYDDQDAVHLTAEVDDIDLGPPTYRESSTLLANANGSRDRTSKVGPRAISIPLLIFGDNALVSRIMRFADPELRWKLRITGLGLWPTVEAEVRAAPFRATFTREAQWSCTQPMVVNVVVPGGLMYGISPQTFPIDLSLTGQTGRVYNRDHNWRHGFLPLSGAVSNVITSGWYRSYPVVTLQGTLSAPVITNLTTGESLSLPGLELNEDETAVVDFGQNSVTIVSASGSRRADSVVDKKTARWWSVRPQVATTIRVTSSAAAAPANASVLIRDAYL